MKFLEKDLEEILFEQLQTSEGVQELEDRGIYLPGRKRGSGPYASITNASAITHHKSTGQIDIRTRPNSPLRDRLDWKR